MTDRRGAVAVGAAVLLVIVLSVGAFLVTTKDDGSATPEQAVTEMIAAVQQGDLVRVFEQLPPGERHALQDGVTDLGGQLQRLGLITSFDPRHVTGVQPTFDQVRWIVTEIGKDTTAVDLTTGTMTVPIAANGSPPLTDQGREVLHRLGADVDPSATTWTVNFEEHPLRLMTIREGGGWHVSLAYSVAEAIRMNAEVELPDMGHGPPGRGGANPASAVTDLVRGYADGDPEQVLAMMYPDEARSLYDYAPAFLPDAHERAKRAADQGTYDVQLNKVETEVTGGGATRRVKVTALDLDIRDEVHKTHVTYDGRCLHTDVRIDDDDEPYAKSDTCDGDWGTEDATARIRDNPIANLAIFGGGADLPTFTVVEKQGRWYISAARTLLSSMVDTLAALPADKVDVFADRIAASWRAGAGGGISGDPVYAPDGEDIPDVVRAVLKQHALIDTCGTLATGDQRKTVTKACVDRLVATGKVDAANVPADL